jgi:hypothetical protein
MPPPQRIEIALLLAIVVMATGFAGPSPAAACAAIPRPIKAFVAYVYPSWAFTFPDDLSSADREAWQRRHTPDCPGFVSGRFKSAGGTAHAALLISVDTRAIRQQLIVLDPNERQSSPEVVWSAEWRLVEGPTARAIWRVAPGELLSADGARHVTTTLDSIALDKMEAGARVFYWQDGAFRWIDVRT